MTAPNLACPSFRIRGEQGYALLALMLMVSVLAIAAAAVAPSIAFQIRRDRETELIHRAMQYRRAVRKFAKQTGRYPMTLDDLESSNGVRYLRKRYKDPMTGRDFRLLHMADIPAVAGASSTVSPPKGTGVNGVPLDSASPTGEEQAAGSSGPSFNNPSDSPSTNQVFGGGVIIGIASTSTKKTIREFDHRNQYNQWLFFYDPGYETAFEVQGPTPLTHPAAALQNASNSRSPTPPPSPSQP